MHAATQAAQLHTVVLAAVDRQHMKAGQARGIGMEGFGNLDGQLAGRRQHQHLRHGFFEIDAG